MELYTPSEIEQLQQDLPYLIEISQWLKTFLSRSHPDLGRPGPVCPFVPKAIKLDCIRLRVIRSHNLVQQQVINIVLPYLNTFLELEPREQDDSLNKAILLLFPDISHEDAPRLIDSVQKELKPLFVESGLMLGEFHKRNHTPGLHNPNFRPLRSPIPMLAIRFMVESDLPFLQNAEDLNLRIRYLEAYLKRFENKFKDENNFKNARQSLALAKLEVKTKTLLLYIGG
ncbi:DUF6875 domain-containing protein [Calothrix sp. NIES-2098]|uniref:DUF6875 domain-containing protein n=1 Tax=Calothrix sp. NIES-2098 TaxID=1954171 RepID=UPI000B5E1002|nr:hypothetical protein NIES2098_35010 [Calothrix sp. NIES-2098]